MADHGLQILKEHLQQKLDQLIRDIRAEEMEWDSLKRRAETLAERADKAKTR